LSKKEIGFMRDPPAPKIVPNSPDDCLTPRGAGIRAAMSHGCVWMMENRACWDKGWGGKCATFQWGQDYFKWNVPPEAGANT
jgi:hypothetical protein